MNTEILSLQSKLEQLQADKATLEAKKRGIQKEIHSFDPSEYYTEEDYKEELNQETVTIFGIEYSVGTVLQAVDEPAFNQGYNEWLESKDFDSIPDYSGLVEQLVEIEDEIYDIESEIGDIELSIITLEDEGE